MRASGQLTKVYPFLLGELSHSLKVHWAARSIVRVGITNKNNTFGGSSIFRLVYV